MKWAILVFCMALGQDCFGFDWWPCHKRFENQQIVVLQPVVQQTPLVVTPVVYAVQPQYFVRYEYIRVNAAPQVVYYPVVQYAPSYQMIPVYKY